MESMTQKITAALKLAIFDKSVAMSATRILAKLSYNLTYI